MGGTILTETSGFTPVIDALATEVGLIPAAVYGVVWRHCQMRDGICKASLQTMADKLGCDRSTLKRHLKTLCEAGYIEDATPDAKHVPHIYRDTGRVKIRALIEVGAEVGQSAPPRWGAEHDQGGAECPTRIPLEETMKETKENTTAAGAADGCCGNCSNGLLIEPDENGENQPCPGCTTLPPGHPDSPAPTSPHDPPPATTAEPHRVQRSRKKGAKLPENTVCVTRGTRWGNPYRAGDPGIRSANDACLAHRDHLRRMPFGEFRALIVPLRRKNLACWCDLEPGTDCHADLLLELARFDDAELRRWWEAECPDCHKPRATTGTNSTGDCCACAGEAALAEVFGEREEPSSRPAGHWSENAREQSVAVPAQAGGAHSAAEGVVDEMCRFNGLPGIGALSKAQRREWIRLVAKTIDEYEATADQARVAWQGWTVRNGFRDSIDPHYSSWPSEFGALLAGVKAGTITRASLKREQKGGKNGQRKTTGSGGTGAGEVTDPAERRRLAGLMRGSTKRAAQEAARE